LTAAFNGGAIDMNVVAILGLGLMGGSLGLALKRRKPDIIIQGHTRSPGRGAMALERGAIDTFFKSADEAVKNADIVVLCAPIMSIPAQLESIVSSLKPGALVTDVGSTKQVIQDKCREILAGRDACFIGSHPIAGSEQQGIEAARHDLYEEAMVVITPSGDEARSSVATITSLWSDIGAQVCEMSPLEHDKILATTSHLPHIMSSLLAATIGRPGLRADLPAFCGTGYRDTTRIAEGGTDIWIDIVKSNRPAIIKELFKYRENLNLFIEKLELSEFIAIEEILNAGKTSRKAFTEYGNQINSEE